jgi:hypothetical protein
MEQNRNLKRAQMISLRPWAKASHLKLNEHSTNDNKVDIGAWKNHLDSRASQAILFGQCAAGNDWSGAKLTKLDPEIFWDQWMLRGKVSSLLRSVFMPHRIFRDEEWNLHARKTRLLFDRCRVVASAHADTV